MAAATIQRKNRSKSMVVMALARGRLRSARAWVASIDAQAHPPRLGGPGNDDGRRRRRATENQVLGVGEGDEHGRYPRPHGDPSDEADDLEGPASETDHIADVAAGPGVEHGLARPPRLPALPRFRYAQAVRPRPHEVDVGDRRGLDGVADAHDRVGSIDPRESGHRLGYVLAELGHRSERPTDTFADDESLPAERPHRPGRFHVDPVAKAGQQQGESKHQGYGSHRITNRRRLHPRSRRLTSQMSELTCHVPRAVPRRARTPRGRRRTGRRPAGAPRR